MVAELLKQILGEKTYWKLKSEGQFEIFSKHHMRKAQGMETGNYTKDLTPIIKPPESPENLILVDDDSSYIADGQKPYIPPIDLQHCDYSNNSFDYDTFPKNAAYYLIGLFKSYFKNPKYNNLPIREAFQIILPDRDSPEMRDLSKSGFVHEIICEGLSEVRKTFGEAIFYGFQIWKMALIPEIAIDSKYDSDESGDDTLIIPDPDDQDGSKLRHSRYIKPKITNPMFRRSRNRRYSQSIVRNTRQ
ncbi:MAG UNVERIFIED_CONTAM: hypothetical protein LVQ98_06975 [Rickettsiaceae bacterium]